MYIKVRTTYFDRYYSNFSPENCQDKNGNPVEPWIIPAYNLVDLNVGYSFKPIKGEKYALSINGNITNFFNTEYISDASNNSTYIQKTFNDNDAKSAEVFFGAPRRFVINVEFRF